MKLEEKFTPIKSYITHLFLDSEENDFNLFLGGVEILKNPEFQTNFIEKEIEYINEFKKHLKKIQKKWEIKNQHYVPQFYLRLFANADGRLETLDKKKHKLIKPQSPKQICSDIYFYAIESGKSDFTSQLLENLFWYYENNFSAIHSKLVSLIESDSHLEQDIIYELCFFASNLWMRWKYFRDKLCDMDEKMIKDLSRFEEKMGWSGESDLLKHIKANKDNNSQHLIFISDENNIRGFANLLFYQKITIYIATGERNFVTSDNPVIEIFPAYRRHPLFGLAFWERLHYFALNKRILFEFDANPGGPSPDLIWKKPKRKRIGDDKVTYFNLLRSMYSEYMYSSVKSDFIEQEYSIARTNYIDDLVQIDDRPEFIKDKNTIIAYKNKSIEEGLHFKSNDEMVEFYKNRIFSRL